MQAEKQEVETLLKTARGQIDGILKMVEENRYCVDICNQLMATTSILKKTNLMIMEAHVCGCVLEAIKNEQSDEKLEEIVSLIRKIAKM